MSAEVEKSAASQAEGFFPILEATRAFVSKVVPASLCGRGPLCSKYAQLEEMYLSLWAGKT